MAMRGFFLDNGAFEKYSHRISARRMMTILRKASDSTMFPDDPDKGDNLFVPKTPQESEYWKILRDEIKASANRYGASRENGKKGGRPPKSAPQPDNPPQPATPPLSAAEKAAAARNLIAGLGKTLGNKKPYATVLITDDFDLTRLEGPLGEALRMTFPPNRSDTLARLSKWLRQPDKFLGQTADSQWLHNKAKRFYSDKK